MILGHTDNIPVDSWALKMVSLEFYGGEPVGRAGRSRIRALGQVEGMAYWFWDWEE
jgi:hypothetical protein